MNNNLLFHEYRNYNYNSENYLLGFLEEQKDIEIKHAILINQLCKLKL